VRPKSFLSLCYIKRKPYTYLAPTHLHCLETNQNKIPHDPRHLGVPSGASKMTSEPMVHSVQTVLLFCDLQMDQNPLPLEDRHLGVPLGASKMIYEPMVLLVQPRTYLTLTITLSPNRPKRASS
jgi:hypothetical protein